MVKSFVGVHRVSTRGTVTTSIPNPLHIASVLKILSFAPCVCLEYYAYRPHQLKQPSIEHYVFGLSAKQVTMNLETPQSKSRAIWIGIAVIMASGIASGFGISFTTH